MQKLNVLFIVARYWRAVACSPITGAKQLLATAMALLVPVAFGSGWFALRVEDLVGANPLDRGAILTAVAILVGFLFALVTWIFQLRRDYSPSPILDSTDASIPRLLDETFTAAAYGTLVTGFAAIICVLKFEGGSVAQFVHESLIIATSTHLVTVLMLLVRRLAIAYDKLIGEKDDVEQKLRADPKARALLHSR